MPQTFDARNALPSPPPSDPTLTLKQRLQLVPPARIIAAVEDSGEVLTLGDLRQFSKYLAEEFGHDAEYAALSSPVWFAEQIEHCTLEQARTVRQMTIELCQERTLLRPYGQGLLAGGIRRAEALDAFGVAMAFLILLLVLPLLLHDDATPSEPQAAPISAPVAPMGTAAVR